MKSAGCAVGMALSLVALSTLASAQQEEQRQQQQLQDREQIERQLAQPGDFVRASDLMGKNIQTAAGEDLGEIKNLIVDENQNRVAYVIVSYGGFLDIGDKLAPVPWQALTLNEDERLVLDVSKDQLKTSPMIESVDDADFTDKMFINEIHTFYGTKPGEFRQTQARAEISPEAREAAEAQAKAAQDARMQGAKRTCAMNEILGADVRNLRNDKNLGEIKDVIIDADNGFLSFAMVSYGGVLGLFDETAAVPWSALGYDTANEVYALNATEETLKSAQLDVGDYKRLSEDRLSRDLHTSFNTEPSWIHGYVSPEPQRKDELNHPAAEEGRMSQKSLTGKVERREMVRPTRTGATEEIVVVHVRPADGPLHVVHLVPEAKLQAQNIDFDQGDEIMIVGFERDIQGQKAIQATEITVNGQRYVLFTPVEIERFQSNQQRNN